MLVNNETDRTIKHSALNIQMHSHTFTYLSVSSFMQSHLKNRQCAANLLFLRLPTQLVELNCTCQEFVYFGLAVSKKRPSYCHIHGDINCTVIPLSTQQYYWTQFVLSLKVILYSYLILKKMNERITDSEKCPLTKMLWSVSIKTRTFASVNTCNGSF